MLLKEQRQRVIRVAQKAQETGLIILTSGNFSLLDRETGYACVTPSGMEYSELEPEDIVVLDLEGGTVEGKRRPSIETPMHLQVYKKRDDVYGVCHTHSTFATAWACVDEKFPVILAELAAMLGGELEKAPFRTMGTPELAEIVASTLKDKNAVLMANHGVLAVGQDIDKAFNHAFIIEEAAKIAFYAKNIGKLNLISSEQSRDLQEWIAKIYGQREK